MIFYDILIRVNIYETIIQKIIYIYTIYIYAKKKWIKLKISFSLYNLIIINKYRWNIIFNIVFQNLYVIKILVWFILL